MSRAYAAILSATFVDALSYGVIGPVIPRLADGLGLGTRSAAFLVAFSAVGALVSLFPRMVFLSKRPPKVVLIGGLVLGAVAYWLFAVTASYPLLLALRFAQGVAAGAVWLGALHLALALESRKAGAAMGGILATYAAGTLLGPLLGLFPGRSIPFVVLAGLNLLVLLPVVLATPMAMSREMRIQWNVLRDPHVLAGTVSAAAVGGGLGLIYGFYALVFAQGMSESMLAIMLTLVALPSVVLSPLAGRYSDKHSPMMALTAALILYTVALALVPLTSTIALWWILLSVAAAAYAVAETGGLALSVSGGPVGKSPNASSAVWGLSYDVGYFVVPPIAASVATVANPTLAPVPVVAMVAVTIMLLIRATRGSKRLPASEMPDDRARSF